MARSRRSAGSSRFGHFHPAAKLRLWWLPPLGTGEDAQIIDGLMNEYKEDFMLNYNFPPFSVGECGRMGSPGRREIGHGKLAWRAIHPMMPKDKDAFPYTIRVVSEILESNGFFFDGHRLRHYDVVDGRRRSDG